MAKRAGLAAALWFVACGAQQPAAPVDPTPPPATAHERPATAPNSEVDGAVASSVPQPRTLVRVVDRDALATLASQGFGLGPLVAGIEGKTTKELAQHPGMRRILRVLTEDVRETKRRFPLARPTSMLGFRQFDERWLSSSEMSFDLVGIFNRLDRRVFYTGTCGEVRFVYRLRYETTQGERPMTGRLPLSVNVVFLVAPGAGSELACVDVARSWQRLESETDEPLSTWLVRAGPLSSAMRQRWTLKSVETNLQTIRLQSTVHTSLAGHIEYAMHVFHPRDATRAEFFEATLENMPDVAKLKANPALRQQLLAWLKQPKTLADIDTGTLNVPENFLARRAVSVSPRGLTRLGNRPFRELFDETQFADLDLSHTRTIRSPKALLRRLDGASCTGCHQSRSIAGFHHVGELSAEEPVGPTLFNGSSMHLQADLARREHYVSELSAGGTPDEFRPLPERQGAGQQFAAPCGLGDAGFEDWQCGEGFSCQKLEDAEVGSCLPEAGVGMPCEYGTPRPGKTARHDRVQGLKRVSCSEGMRCDLNIQGFPLGSCAAACRGLGADGVCGWFLDIDGYQNCLRGKLENSQCAEKFVFKTGLRRCDEQQRCRQDFVCVKTAEPSVGACVPPYFVYGLRNDGYPLMR